MKDVLAKLDLNGTYGKRAHFYTQKTHFYAERPIHFNRPCRFTPRGLGQW